MNRILRFFAPDNQEFYRLFNEAGQNLTRGTALLEELLDAPKTKRKDIIKEIGRCEHEGDRLTAEIIERLNKTFVTPFEREDIYELASTLDDILDLIEDTADYILMYRLQSIRPHAIQQAKLITQACNEISQALGKLTNFKNISDHIAAVKEHEHIGDKLMRTAMAELFKNEIRPKRLIAWKSMFDALEKTLNAAEHHANILKGIVVKNS